MSACKFGCALAAGVYGSVALSYTIDQQLARIVCAVLVCCYVYFEEVRR